MKCKKMKCFNEISSRSSQEHMFVLTNNSCLSEGELTLTTAVGAPQNTGGAVGHSSVGGSSQESVCTTVEKQQTPIKNYQHVDCILDLMNKSHILALIV